MCRVSGGREVVPNPDATDKALANLEGQPSWRSRGPNGRLPAPPHDASGHTWHHPDQVLFSITKNGLVLDETAPSGYESDMPAFKATLLDSDIAAALAYIKSAWPESLQAAQREATREYRSR